jgi:hypothetical protein
MSEPFAPQPQLVTELSGVASAEQKPGPGESITLYYTQILPHDAPNNDSAELHELALDRDDIAVLRFAGATGTHEHIEYFGGQTDDPRSELDEACFAYPSRRGDLRVLDRERAHTIARYIGNEVGRLRRLEGRGAPQAPFVPRQRRNGHRSGGHPGIAPSGTRMMMAERQQQVINQITELATHDFIHGIFEPDTARERAAMHLGDPFLDAPSVAPSPKVESS